MRYQKGEELHENEVFQVMKTVLTRFFSEIDREAVVTLRCIRNCTNMLAQANRHAVRITQLKGEEY